MRSLFIALVATGLAMVTLGCLAEAYHRAVHEVSGVSFSDRLDLTALVHQCQARTHLCP